MTLTVTDNAAATSQTAHVVTVNAPPVASFTSACSGLTCSFNASGSSDPDGTIASYAWTFGDAASGSGATANRTTPRAAPTPVTLTVTDNAAATSQTVRTVTVNAPPIASFTSAAAAHVQLQRPGSRILTGRSRATLDLATPRPVQGAATAHTPRAAPTP